MKKNYPASGIAVFANKKLLVRVLALRNNIMKRKTDNFPTVGKRFPCNRKTMHTLVKSLYYFYGNLVNCIIQYN